jgi:hypothetical protein
MLGQHPQLYGLPEVNPFLAETLGKAASILQMVRPRTLDGLHRTIAQIEFGGQTDETITKARFWLKNRQSWSAPDLFRYLSERVGYRGLVEKSPSTVLAEKRLYRARALFPDAYFLHLTRHPRATCKSIHEITAKSREANAGLRQALQDNSDPEDIWRRINLGILRFTDSLPSGQWMHIRGEDLLGNPPRFLQQICEWLGIDYNEAALEAMLHPENSVYARIGPNSAPFGNDPNFLRKPYFTQREIPPQRLAGPAEWRTDGTDFTAETVELAGRFGYA